MLKLIDGRPITFIRQSEELFNPTTDPKRHLGGWNETGTGRISHVGGSISSASRPRKLCDRVGSTRQANNCAQVNFLRLK